MKANACSTVILLAAKRSSTTGQTGSGPCSISAQSTVDNIAYGYFWWRPLLKVNSAHAYLSADQGNGGQKIYVVPACSLVAVFTGGLYNSGSPMNAIMATDILLRLIAAYPNATTRP